MKQINLKKQKIIQSLKKTYCRIQPSKISGVGVYAIRDIPKNTDLFIGQGNQQWHKFHMDKLDFLDDEVKRMIDDFFVIEKDNTVSIPEGGLNGMDISNYLNNSETPNVKTDNGNTFISIRDIKKGEEITVSYKTFDEKYL
jgi:SET domain-containing protein